MHYFIFELLFLLLLLPFRAASFPVSNANNSLKDSKNLLVEFVKNPSKFEQYHKYDLTKEYLAILKLASKTPFGLLYFLQKNWKCDKIGDKFTEQKEIEGCKTYHEYVGILYEYLNFLNAGILLVEPKFYFDKIYAYSTLTETVESLAIIWKFYFNTEFGESKGHKLETLFIRYFKPKLWNKDQLYYEANLDNSKENPTKFDQFLEAKFKEWKKRMVGFFIGTMSFLKDTENFNIDVKLLPNRNTVNKFYDDTFIAFVRGQSHFDQLLNELEKDGQLGSGKCSILGLNDKKELARTYANRLYQLYWMKQNWKCDEFVKELSEEEAISCRKFYKYMVILYEYLFQVYAKTEVPELVKKCSPSVRPMFKTTFLCNVITKLHFHYLLILPLKKQNKIMTFLLTHSDICSTMDSSPPLFQFENKNEFDNYKANIETENYGANVGKWNEKIVEDWNKDGMKLMRRNSDDDPENDAHV